MHCTVLSCQCCTDTVKLWHVELPTDVMLCYMPGRTLSMVMGTVLSASR